MLEKLVAVSNELLFAAHGAARLWTLAARGPATSDAQRQPALRRLRAWRALRGRISEKFSHQDCGIGTARLS
jgi:hypothetical protein